MKKRLCLIISCVLLFSLLYGCGETKEAATAQTEVKTETSTEATVSPEETKLNTIELFEKFLKGEEKLHFDLYTDVYRDEYIEGLENGIFSADEELLIDDFIKKFGEGASTYWGDEFELGDIKYAYIDCGADGKPDLALLIENSMIFNSGYDDIFVISEIDSKLELCYQFEYGYRSSGSINEYGYINYNGSDGASAHYYEYDYVNGNGEPGFLYSVEEYYGIYGLYVPDVEVDMFELADDLGIGEKIYIEQYDFEGRGQDTDLVDFDYGAYVRSLNYTYNAMDDDFNIVDDESIFEEESAYKKFWDQIGLPFNTRDEIDEMLWERLASKGVTSKIVDGKEVTEWTLVP